VTALNESDALHARVVAFARATIEGRPAEAFDELATAIARYQERHIPGFRRLVASRGALLTSAEAIPAVPVDAFRLTRVAAHPAELDVARFETSGTTGASRGVHAYRTLATYRELALLWGERGLGANPASRVVVALAPADDGAERSSLAFMMRTFIERFDGRPLSEAAPGSSEPGRWLTTPDGTDLVGLRHAVRMAHRRSEPILVLATAFALALLFDQLGGATLDAPPGSVVMTTGGFKGRTREIAPDELVHRVSQAFGVEESCVIGEYGMTELTSQLYEGVLPRGRLRGSRGIFLPPPWLRVTPVDPETLELVRDDEVGLARFVDLGNVDSAVAVVTQDLVRRSGDGIELLGRRPGAPLRGCSLAIEDMVLGARSS
jgi:hypothetical protein